jgi:hypothetical protein
MSEQSNLILKKYIYYFHQLIKIKVTNLRESVNAVNADSQYGSDGGHCQD